MFSRVAIFLAQHTPRGIKQAVHKIRPLHDFVMSVYGSFLSGSELPIKDGPLRGVKLATGQHTSHAHINGTYEREVQDAIQGMVGQGDVCYDLGASIGYMTLIMAQKGGQVYAFEPSPEAIKEMERHIAANRLRNIEIIPVPVSNNVREVRFGITNTAYGSGINEEQTRWPVLKLKTTTLDLFARDHKPPDFLKIDVQGEEGAVLEGARGILASARPKICCEIHNPGAARAVLEILAEFNYDATLLDGSPARVPENIVEGEEYHFLAHPNSR